MGMCSNIRYHKRYHAYIGEIICGTCNQSQTSKFYRTEDPPKAPLSALPHDVEVQQLLEQLVSEQLASGRGSSFLGSGHRPKVWLCVGMCWVSADNMD